MNVLLDNKAQGRVVDELAAGIQANAHISILSSFFPSTVFKDAGFIDDVVKTNAVQILRQAGIDDVKSL